MILPALEVYDAAFLSGSVFLEVAPDTQESPPQCSY